MRLLVLGGTDFVGWAVAEEGVARGWDVTTLSRGTHAPPPGTRALVGDRREQDGLGVLGTESWDIIVDTWSWEPSVVRDTVQLLADRVGRYAYISSISVQSWPKDALADESWPTVEASADDTGFADYARAKRGSEIAVEAKLGDRSLILRPGLILGPRENIGRLPWWLTRMALGGDVLAPAPAAASFQYIDARDLARFTLDGLENGLSGSYSVVNEADTTTMGQLLDAARSITGDRATLRWVSAQAILDAGIEPWTDLPIWVPLGADHDAMHRSSVSRALAAGLAVRPLEQTVADTWSWLQSIGGTAPQRPDRPAPGLDPERERAVLAAHPDAD